LRILPAGGSTQTPHTALNIRRLAAVMDELSQVTEVVLIEAPSVVGGSDTAILAEQADFTLLVVDLRRGRRADASAAVRTLSHVESRLLGCVVNDPGRRPQPPGLPRPDGVFHPEVRNRRMWSKFRGSSNGRIQNSEGSEHASPSKTHSNDNEADIQLGTGSRPLGADAHNGRSRSADSRVADLQ
jgi:hypothetical protein